MLRGIYIYSIFNNANSLQVLNSDVELLLAALLTSFKEIEELIF